MHSQGEGTFVVRYMGASMLDSRIVYTAEMLPWIISEILRFSEDEQVILQLRNSIVTIFGTKDFHNRKLYEIPIWDCVRYFQVDTGSSVGPPSPSSDLIYFCIIVKSNSTYHHIRLFSSFKSGQVTEIMSTFAEATTASEPVPVGIMRSSSVSKSLGPIDSSDAISFEVLYLGKLRMSYKKAPPSFIDDALEKFRAHESGRGSREQEDRDRSRSRESRSDTGEIANLLKQMEGIDELDRKVEDNSLIGPNDLPRRELIVPKAPFPHPLEDVTYANGERVRNISGEDSLVKSLSLPVKPMRSRALSMGHKPRDHVLVASKAGSSSSNRTMILIIANREVRIISPDAKTILFHKSVQDISQTTKGIQNTDCFGFICREISSSGVAMYVGFIFRCESDKVSSEILHTLKRVSSMEGMPRRPQLYCDHCPMVWYHNLCVDVDGLPDFRARHMIQKKIEALAEEDRQNILMKLEGAETQSLGQQVELMMMLIRAHCESKQLNHIHDTPENRHEFLNSYLGGGAIFMKAKRTLTNSLDQFMKRKEQRGTSKGLNALLPHHAVQHGKEMSPTDPLPDNQQSEVSYSDSPLESGSFRQRSSTLGAYASEKIVSDLKNSRRSSQVTPIPAKFISTPQKLPLEPIEQNQHSPMMNIFLKVGPQQSKPTCPSSSGPKVPHVHRKGSWRQAIFKRVVSPSSGQSSVVSPPVAPFTSMTPLSSKKVELYRPKKSQQEVRDLWTSAIKQQIMLNRMERQNCMLKNKQEEAYVKRSKLSYIDMCGSGDRENLGIDALSAKANTGQVVDMCFFRAVCITGIPKHKRGQVWQIFLKQYSLRAQEEADVNSGATQMNCIPSPSPSYEELIRQLTSHQHAILIDLGRTFPNHPYFSSPLGSGQLALYNLLKAYSLLDTDVGYCQGLSFVAGLLLMHLEEKEAFDALKYFMFEMGGREYYKPDMSGLQLKLYQLNRLIYDQDPDIHLLLYHNDVLPTLYAAPWFLTMFAAQFPIGFSARVMDLAFVQGPDVMVKFALVLIQDHKKQLMECVGLEQIMECFKSVVTQITPSKVDDYVRKAFDMKIDRQMLVYGVEYNVMHDETFLAYLSDPNYHPRISKLRERTGRGSFDENKERASPTPSSQGSDDDNMLDNNNGDPVHDEIRTLGQYIATLEQQLNAYEQDVRRPAPVKKILEKIRVPFFEPTLLKVDRADEISGQT